MTAPRKRRVRSPHPGVKLNRRTLKSGRVQWRARFVDPDTGREVDVTLDTLELSTQVKRAQWAKDKARALAKRRMELESGAPVVDAKPMREAVADYLESGKHRLRERTLTTYQQGLGQLTAWASRDGVRTTADLTAPKLASFREYLIAQPKQQSKVGGKRGEWASAGRKRKPASVNVELRAVKTFLNMLRRTGRLPAVSKDDIGDTLKPLPEPREQPKYLTPAELRELLTAAQKHDAAVFNQTREEHAGKRPRGTSRRYEPIAPFLAFLLLTGCRRGEALSLKWADVDLDAVDTTGRPVGEIRLRAEATKTHRARTIGLDVSPALRTILLGMKDRATGRPSRSPVFADEGGRAYTADLVEAARRRMLSKTSARPTSIGRCFAARARPTSRAPRRSGARPLCS